jgi:hypothetical protein
MFTLVLLLAAHLQASHTLYPVQWTSAVGPSSRSALEAKLGRPVKIPRGQEIFTRSDPSREIHTCADYLRARRK